MHFLVRHLSWSDLDPRRHAFDPQQAREAIASAVGQFTIHHALRPDRRADVAAAIDRALIAQVGAWSAGWSWSASEPGDGGPVPTSAYCCAEHSLVGSREDVTEIALGAVSAWRARLEDLAALFDELASVTEPTADAAVRAATRLLPQVVEWTNTDDAWYATFDAILRWALEHRGVDPADAARWVAASTKGHFASWCAPTPDALDAVSKTLRRETAQGETPPIDAMARWLQIREDLGIERKRFYAPPEVRFDAHLRLIATFDAIRDPMRAERMRQALACARADAEGGAALTLERLAGWQALVLGGPAPLRTTDAFAHEGRDRYGVDDLRNHLERCLAGANDGGPVIQRASRAYLDVCFLHPFVDGNARAARLVLDFVLWREGLALHAVEPIALIARRPLGRDDLYWFLLVVDFFAGPRG